MLFCLFIYYLSHIHIFHNLYKTYKLEQNYLLKHKMAALSFEVVVIYFTCIDRNWLTSISSSIIHRLGVKRLGVNEAWSLFFIQGSFRSSRAFGLRLELCCKHLSMKFWHSSETSDGMLGLSRFTSLYCKAMCTLLSPSSRVPHGFCPEIISTTRQPKDQISDLRLTFCRWVSGAIQAGELPTIDYTLSKLLELACRSTGLVEMVGALSWRELPMSHSLISLPSWLTRTLAPFRSPCVTF